jgi:hypothetical protein
MAAVLAVSVAGYASTYTVVNTEDAGAGSLRQAIIEANSHAGPDTIIFDIPKTGTLFNGNAWFIVPETDLPALMDDATLIDGDSQTRHQGNTNPDGPEIYLSGYSGKASHLINNGFIIRSAHNLIKGLIISAFNQHAIYLSGTAASNNRITGNYIGLNFSGRDTISSPNNTGIYLDEHAHHNQIGGAAAGERNVISGNRYSGVYFYESDDNLVVGNYIGTDKDGYRALGNYDTGVYIWGSKGNIIGGLLAGESNLISGNSTGVLIYGTGAAGNWVVGNSIGTDLTGARGLGGQRYGVTINDGHHNRIGPANMIRFSSTHAITVEQPAAIGNTITQNSISDSDRRPVGLAAGANEAVPAPDLFQTADGVAGMTLPYVVVEIFSDPAGEGLIYEGAVKSDASGAFVWTGPLTGPTVSANMTDSNGNTSEFSLPVLITQVDEANRNAHPGQFTLSQNYPNPFNPATTIEFALARPERVRLQIMTIRGEIVTELIDGLVPAGTHAVSWNAGEQANGVYLILLEAAGFRQMRKAVLIK